MTNVSDVTTVTTEAAINAVVAAHRDDRGPLLEILHAVQSELGHIPEEAVPLIARELNITRADVHGVITFYHDFRDAPAGRTTVRICRAEACQALGAAELVNRARQAGTPLGGTSADGAVTVEQVFCLGNCALGPCVEVNGKVLGRMTEERLRTILDEAVNS